MDILIVDDSMLANHAIKSYFTKLGHNVVGIARDGIEGKIMFTESEPDLVTVDAVMPGNVSGADFVKYVNSSDKDTGKSTKILFISSDEVSSYVKNELKVNKYLVKPVTLSHIEDAVSKL
ncbi:MAG: response regulator transcription factor [Candidatus Kariarchaeaceae archaeon]|jgi:YesN/AraC family two-component response regulator